MRSPRALRLLVALLLLGTLVVAGPAGAYDGEAPYFVAVTFTQHPGVETDLDLAFSNLAARPAAENATITVPEGYGVATPPLGTGLGSVYIDAQPAAGGDDILLAGKLQPELPAALAADFATCAPGTHAAAMHAVVTDDNNKEYSLAVAVDPAPGGGSYVLTMCFDAFHAAGLVLTSIDLITTGVFTNPPDTGTWTWTVLMTPFAADGTPDPSQTYELRSDEPLPETVSAKPSYDPAKHLLTVRGVVLAAGAPRDGVRVHVYSGAARQSLREVGVALTRADGSYVFTQKQAKAPAFVDSDVWTYLTDCDGSAAPGGCPNGTIDGASSSSVAVPKPKAKPKPKPKPKRKKKK